VAFTWKANAFFPIGQEYHSLRRKRFKRLDILYEQAYGVYMKWFTEFVNNLLTPTVTVREQNDDGLSLKNSLIANAVFAEVISGKESTLLDKAVFIGMPYAVRAVAIAGAQKGFGESKN
jgi:hypothetical protein